MNATLRFTLLALALAALSACGPDEPEPQRVEITVGESTYEPSEVRTTVGTPLTLVFTRTTDDGCGTEVVIASENIRRDLPLNEPVEIAFTPTEAGSLRFTCGMDMFEGAIVVAE